MKWLWLLFTLWVLPAAAASPVDLAQTARTQLETATAFMLDASEPKARISALTQAVQAYEVGLSALREGLRQSDDRRAFLQAKLHARDAKTGQLLSALMMLQPGQTPKAFLHPQGARGALQAGLMLRDVSTSLEAEAQQLRADLEEVETLTALQREAEATLETGLLQVQEARLALHQAVAQRTDLPFRFIADPVKAGLLIASADTLDAFAASLNEIVTDDLGWTPTDLTNRMGQLRLPAQGQIVMTKNATPTGLSLRTMPGALVTSPIKATIRYSGPLLDMGQVVLIEPAPNTLIVLAGLDRTYVEAGQIAPEGTPLGLMGGLQADFIEIETSTDGERGGAQPVETLYIEVRRDNIPQDPAMWFRIDKDG